MIFLKAVLNGGDRVVATCKDCICYSGCSGILNDFGMRLNPAREVCDRFEDHARFVELPCVAGEYVYVIEPIFGKSIEHTIRRRKIKSIEPHAEIKFYGSWIHDFLSGFGRYIFSTYEEAEQALKEREDEKLGSE